MQSYCTYYTESYVEQRLSLSPSTGLLGGDYDHYECISILEDDTNAMLEFLKAKKDDHPDFRSSKTGYSYAESLQYLSAIQELQDTGAVRARSRRTAGA